MSIWLAGRLAVDPMQLRRVIDMLSVSIKPHIVVGVVTVWDKPLKHVVDVLICDDRQCGVQASTKLSGIIPTQHWTVRVETIFLIVHWVALGEGRYHIYDVQQNQHTSCRTSAHSDQYNIFLLYTVFHLPPLTGVSIARSTALLSNK